MSKNSIKQLLKKISLFGYRIGMDRLEVSRLQLVNSLLFISISVCVIMAGVTVIEGLYRQASIIVTGGLILCLTYIFIHKGYYAMARSYLVGIGSLVIIGLSLNAYPQGLFNDTENILFAYMAVSILLFSGAARYYRYWVMYLVIVLLKIVRQHYIGEPYDLSFYILIQNTTVLAVLLYLFLLFFYGILERTVNRLSASQRTLYDMIDNTSLFMALFNTDGTYRIVNKHYEKAFNIPRDDIQGKHAHEIMPAGVAEWQSEVIQQAIETGQPVKTKRVVELPGGKTFVGYGRANPVKDDTGRVIAVAGFIDNISELEDIKEKLEAANKSKDRLFSIVAHDIKSPIATFESILESTKYQVVTVDNFGEFINDLKLKFGPIKNTIGDMLKWAHANLDDMEAKKSCFDSDMVLSDLISQSESFGNEKQIVIEKTGFGNEICMDEDHFRIAIRNILQNAIKFSPENAIVTVDSKPEDAYVMIRIIDHGMGMSPARLDQLRKGSAGMSSKGTGGEIGTGIGLSMVTELLKKNDCLLEIESKEGIGSTFTVKIPTNTKEETI